MERFKPINKYYQISNLGTVRSVKTGDMKTSMSRGFKRVTLSYDGRYETLSVHILVAKAFVRNPLNRPFVVHKKLPTTDNRSVNLKWCNKEEATALRDKKERIYIHPSSRRVRCTLTGKEWDSIRLCAIDLGMTKGSLASKLDGRSKNDSSILYIK